METLVDKIVDCARSHFAWDATESPETAAHMKAFKEKIHKLLRSHRPKKRPKSY